MSAMAELDAFCDEVGNICEKEHGLLDGDDLCYNFIESGQVRMQDGVRRAVDIVAQALLQQ